RPFGPTAPAWTYESADTFYSGFISGARRLASGNTIVASGAPGRIFEVTRGGEIVWEYRHKLHEGELVRRGAPNPQETNDAHERSRVGIFRATRIPLEHPGLAALLAR
ncbi:MAG: hypothetical protein ABL998_18120, partial [Planctomycetota bacterium]